MILGIFFDLLFLKTAVSCKLLGDIFLRLIKSAVAPLIFLTVTLGISATGDIKQIGKIGLIALIYFEVVSTIAILWDFGMGELFSIGSGIVLPVNSISEPASTFVHTSDSAHQGFSAFILNIFPDSFIGAFTTNQLLQVLVLSILFGLGILLPEEKELCIAEKSLNILSSALFKFIHIIMLLVPLGTFGAIAYAVGSNGLDMIVKLMWLVLIFYAALLCLKIDPGVNLLL